MYDYYVNNMPFKHTELRIAEPAFGSELNTVIVELEKLREKRLQGSVPPYVFFEIKTIFQSLESLGSMRIEGNRTTISEFAEKIIQEVSPATDETLRETDGDRHRHHTQICVLIISLLFWDTQLPSRQTHSTF